jgi:peptidyl-prolyl cis-trans isomerase B (cyclophilin B)
MKKIIQLLSLALLAMPLFIQNLSAAGNPTALIHTSMGNIKLELDAENAPVSVENFINYANSGFYDGTIFHRVISYFMIQGGGFTPEMEKKATAEPIANEAGNGLQNLRGTVAMARTNDPHSATAQFFINTQDNPSLNFGGGTNSRNWGYAVFGKVIEGMKVVEDIRFVETITKPPFSDVPKVPVVIESIVISNN